MYALYKDGEPYINGLYKDGEPYINGLYKDGKPYINALYKDGEPYINGEISPIDHGIIHLKVNKNMEAPAEYRAKVKEIWGDIGKLIDLGHESITSATSDVNAFQCAFPHNVVINNIAAV